MNTSRSFALPFVLASFAGCTLAVLGCAADTSPEDSAETSESALSSWKKVVTCDDGALVIDIKGYPMTSEPGSDPEYDVQAVIGDGNILSYFESQGVYIRNLKKPSEGLVSGHIWLRSPNNEVFTGRFGAQVPYGSWPTQADFNRDGARVDVRFTSSGGSTCPRFCTDTTDPEYDPGSGVCEGGCRTIPYGEVANWSFRSCTTVLDVHD